jgi:hypothetical protein
LNSPINIFLSEIILYIVRDNPTLLTPIDELMKKRRYISEIGVGLLFIFAAFFFWNFSYSTPCGIYPSSSLSRVRDTLIGVKVKNLYGFINGEGKLKIKPDFRDVGHFVNGLAPAKKENAWGYINAKGKFVIPEIYDIADDFQNGIARVNRDGKSLYINKSGEYDTNPELTPFGNSEKSVNAETEKFTLKEIDHRWRVLDKTGKVVGREAYWEIDKKGFVDGLAIVQDQFNKNWGVIDCSTHWVIQPNYLRVIRNPGQDKCFFIESGRDEGLKSTGLEGGIETHRYWGIDDYNGNILCRAHYSLIGRDGMRNGLVYVEEQLCYGIINREGTYIWKALKDTAERFHLPKLDTDVMIRGYYYAYSSGKDRSNGWSVSPNSAMKADSGGRAKQGTSGILINKLKSKPFQKAFQGFEVVLYNFTDKEMSFNASDSRLYMKIQAKKQNGEWKDIEYLPSSWCGNSYHVIQLKPGEFWSFTAPVYYGSIKTMLRIELAEVNPDSINKKGSTIYSEEFEGTINPAQFWNKEGHQPHNLIDPYGD